MRETYRILAVNPGSTSTKIAVYDNEQPIMVEVIRHSKDILLNYDTILDQQELREEIISRTLAQKQIPLETINAVVGRGGLIGPISSGTYSINDKMLRDLTDPEAAAHASSLGGVIARKMGEQLNIPSYIVDPVVVDERLEIAKITGLPEIKRNNIWHALNQKAVARLCAEKLNGDYRDFRFIVAHMGGGISVGAHLYGQVVDVTDGLYGEGPLTPERTGALPAGNLIELCYSGKYTKEQLKAFVIKNGGLMAHLNTNSLIEVEKRIEQGDSYAAQIFDAMAYQVSKSIGSMAAVLSFDIDAIVLTGGLAYSNKFTTAISQRIEKLAEIIIYPGEDEMGALARGALRVLKGLEEVKEY